MKRRGFDGFNAAFDFDTGDRDMHRIARLSRRSERANRAQVGLVLPFELHRLDPSPVAVIVTQKPTATIPRAAAA